MNVLVTGGSGQLGTLVVRRLVQDRKVKRVVTLDLAPPRVASPKLEIAQADVRDPSIEGRLAGIDAVVHLAFVVTDLRPRAEFDDINIGGSKNVFAAAARAGVKQIVYSSSVAAYGVVPGRPVPLTEDTPRVLRDDFAYGACKTRIEDHLDEFERAHPALAVCRLRPAILVGAHMEHLLGDALRRRRLFDSGPAPLPLVWDEDVADAIVLALKKQARGAFNLGADEPLPPRELARAAGLPVVKVPAPVARAFLVLSPLLARAGLGRRTDPAWFDGRGAELVMSSEKAKAELGWRPRCPTNADVIRRHLAEVPGAVDPRIALFLRLADLGARSQEPPEEARHISARILLELTGPGGTTWGITVDRGHVRLQPGAPRPPTAVITMRAETFVDLLAGRKNVSDAAFSGKITVEGEPTAQMILAAMVTTFRGEASRPGARGLVARGLELMFRRGAT
jgi:nucleoside-diphosphate-sugar epimerase